MGFLADIFNKRNQSRDGNQKQGKPLSDAEYAQALRQALQHMPSKSSSQEEWPQYNALQRELAWIEQGERINNLRASLDRGDGSSLPGYDRYRQTLQFQIMMAGRERDPYSSASLNNNHATSPHEAQREEWGHGSQRFGAVSSLPPAARARFEESVRRGDEMASNPRARNSENLVLNQLSPEEIERVSQIVASGHSRRSEAAATNTSPRRNDVPSLQASLRMMQKNKEINNNALSRIIDQKSKSK